MKSIATALCLLVIGILPAHNFTLLTVRDAPYNAVGDGVTDDAAAIQRMIDDSCPGHSRTVAVEQQFPVIIPYSVSGNGHYMIGSPLNVTNCLGFAMGGIGSGMTYPVIQQIPGTTMRNIIDMTGSVSGFNLKTFIVYGPLSDGLPNPETAILLAQSDITLHSGNFGSIDKVQWAGRFSKAGLATYGVCCSEGNMMGGTNAIMSAPNSYVWALTDSNVPGFSSDFSNIATGSQGASGWKCSRCENHGFTGASTVSSKALLLEGTRGFLYEGGILAAANGYIIETKGNNFGVTLNTVMAYTDQGPPPGAYIGGTLGTLTNLDIVNMDVELAAGGVVVSVGGYNGSLIGGRLNAGGVVTNYNICGMGSAPAVSGCHIP